jgi:hypothetical protein
LADLRVGNAKAIANHLDLFSASHNVAVEAFQISKSQIIKPYTARRKEMAKKERRGDRFRLLIYERMWQRWAWPCFLTILASLALWWLAPRIAIIRVSLRFLTLGPALISFVILAYAFLARRLSWAQCREGHLRIRTLFYPLAISYGRIKEIRPVNFVQIFEPTKEKSARKRWLRPYWRRTVLVVELSRYPVSKARLRFWLSPYLLLPNKPGLVLLVKDWMTLSRQLHEFHHAWTIERAKRRKQALGRRLR